LQFLDKSALNYANVFGYQQALGLKGQQFNFLAAMVYAGYWFGTYPAGWLIGRYKAQRVMAGSCLIWGLMVILLTQARPYQSALAVRFFLGVFEAAVTPGLTLMTGFYYTRREIPLRQCIWYSSLGWGGIIGSYISMGISTLSPSIRPERWEILFFILGGVTMLWAVFIFAFLPDSPANARFLTERQRLIAVKRVASNDIGIKNKGFKKDQVKVALTDPKALLIFVSVFAAAIPNGVVNSFSTVIIRDMGFSVTKTTQGRCVNPVLCGRKLTACSSNMSVTPCKS
jgi:MFS family permease